MQAKPFLSHGHELLARLQLSMDTTTAIPAFSENRMILDLSGKSF